MELPTTARVVFSTTKGNIEMELWAKETPIASRQFLQNCVDKKYIGLDFKGLESIIQLLGLAESQQIRREFHSRLRFNKRGMVGLVNVEDSQMASTDAFFVTLLETPQFNNQYVLLGKVVGESIYNVIKILEADRKPDGETPLFPITITDVNVPERYFDIEELEVAPAAKKRKKQKPAVKLSYDDEEDDVGFVMKPAHELLADKKLKITSEVPCEAPPTEAPGEGNSPDVGQEDKAKAYATEPGARTETEVKNEAEEEKDVLVPDAVPQKLKETEAVASGEQSENVGEVAETVKIEEKLALFKNHPNYNANLDIVDTIPYEQLRSHRFCL